MAREITVVPRRVVDYERRARTRFLRFLARQKTRKPDRTWSVPRPAGVARRTIKLSVRPLAAVGMHLLTRACGHGPSPRRGRSFQPLGGYLVDPASSHMLVSKIKPCMSKYELLAQ